MNIMNTGLISGTNSAARSAHPMTTSCSATARTMHKPARHPSSIKLCVITLLYTYCVLTFYASSTSSRQPICLANSWWWKGGGRGARQMPPRPRHPRYPRHPGHPRPYPEQHASFDHHAILGFRACMSMLSRPRRVLAARVWRNREFDPSRLLFPKG